MENHDIAGDLAAIETALRDRANPTITGGQLFSLMQSVAPRLNFRETVAIPRGPGALTEFVRVYLSGILEKIGNQGGDILYRVDGRDTDDLSNEETSNLWKNFVSPSSPRHLILERGSKRLVSRLNPASAENDEVELERASTEEHDQIRADFMATLSSSEADEMAKHVTPGTKFADWILALREHLPEAVRRWGLYRRDRLHDLFLQRVTALSLDATLKEKVINQIRASQHSAYERQKEARSTSFTDPLHGKSLAGRKSQDDLSEAARVLTHAAVDLMSYDELRTLKLPLGIVLDALRSRA